MTAAGNGNEILFSPIQVGAREAKNRLVMASTSSALGDHTGAATVRNAAYLERRARGGVGMIVTEAQCSTLGGIYQGDGKIHCCPLPLGPCP